MLLIKFCHSSQINRILPINHHEMKGDKFDNRRILMNSQRVIPKAQQESGSTKDKYPVVLDGGRTTIFISDKEKMQETIERYKNRGKY